MKDKIYIVENRTWSSSNVEKVFKDKERAKEYADKLEMSKNFSDGYVSYYVREFEVN